MYKGFTKARHSAMRICTFRLRGEDETKSRVGLVSRGRVAETTERISMLELLDGGPDAWSRLEPTSVRYSRGVLLSAPLPRPRKILAAIVNTRGMLGGDVTLDRPRVDMKAPSAVIGPGQAIEGRGSAVRPEVELAAVVGLKLARASVEEAKGAIFGYTVLNDVTAPRDSREDAYQAYRRDQVSGELKKATLRGPLFRSKNHDTFCPMGPWVVTADELGGTTRLRMTTRYRGRLVQDGSTAEYIFTPEKLVSYISSFLTLEAGDVVSCGSVGWTRRALGGLDPTEYVCKPGSGLLELTIAGIGTLKNPLVGAKTT